MKNLKSELVLITGGSSGIGRLMAHNFAKEGSEIIIWDINEIGMARVAKEIEKIGSKVWTYVCDVSNKNRVYELAAKIKKEVGKIDILVNNAGIVSGKPFLECSDDQIEKTMDINIMAHFWTVKSFLPEMIKSNHGHIVTIASAAGLVGVNSLSDYSASKFAAVGFDESIRMELKKKKIDGVKTTIVCPYYVNTGMFAGIKTKFDFLLPVLDEKDVAEKIIEAVKNDKPILQLPSIVNLVPLFRILPVNIFDWIADFLGINSAMDEFTGRAKLMETPSDLLKSLRS
ncbi:MAG: SDR family oxidoreductase [Desulfobacterales bacterium]|nr:SDR family oxidoreductase [Desulfobacterales bacterium]MBF0397415.1 SDR family oxidoreductase [Desulfobacterales bacterium]